MGKINILPENVSNLIAAGEVVERPISVVKELVENSLDAGATKINILLEDAGLKEVRVSDNGSGMDVNDAKYCILPHATSKIQNKNDLFSIHTLGFRGEALPSIASVSSFKIITSTDGEKGFMISYRGGIPFSEAMISHAKGTEIVVKNLFYNTPARLQNMKNDRIELSYIVSYLTKIAIARSDVSFKLINNDTTVFSTFGNGNKIEAISRVYSTEIAKNMISIFSNTGLYKISGYISNIDITRASKSNIILVVNGRVISNYDLISAIMKGYGTRLMKNRYPVVVLELNVDASMIDVNVHPTKREVRFSDAEELVKAITECIDTTLKQTNLSVNLDNDFDETSSSDASLNLEDSFYEEQDSKSEIVKSDEPTLDSDDNLPDFKDDEDEYEAAERAEKENNEANDDINFQYIKESFQEKEQNCTSDEEDDKEEDDNDKIEDKKVINQDTRTLFEMGEVVNEKNELKQMYYIGQLFGTYILTQNEETFFLIDQHAANERINYDKIKDEFAKNASPTYDLLVPFSLSFMPDEVILIKDKMNEINDLGIKLEEFGTNSFVVRSIPVWIFRNHEKEFVEEIVSSIIQNRGNSKTYFLDSLAKSLACKKSIKGNEYHTSTEIQYLLEKLSKTKDPYTCPHGRPVIVKLSKSTIEKWFKRVL
ncbi:MAG: DNA mismatch repair endonuclease MutL [Bacilli bacterium]